MHKLKLILVALAIVVLSATSFECIAQAAEVTRINKNRGLIVINGNKEAGFVMGATVCFYSTSGEQITCGSVQQTSESYVTVGVDNRKAKQIRYGMEAQLEDDGKGQGYIGSPKEEKSCVDDSECGNSGYCVNGNCQPNRW